MLNTACLREMQFPAMVCTLNSITLEQIEWLTAGDCIAGMHEVVVTKRTKDAIKLASEQNRSLWRVSSTVSIRLHFHCSFYILIKLNLISYIFWRI